MNFRKYSVAFLAIRRIDDRVSSTTQAIVFVHSDSTKALSKRSKIPIEHERELEVKGLKNGEVNMCDDDVEIPSIPDVLLKAPTNKLPVEYLRIIFEASTLDVMDLVEVLIYLMRPQKKC